MTDEALPIEGAAPAPPEKRPMDESLWPFINKARRRHEKRPPNPGVKIEDAGRQRWRFGATHGDFEAWELQVYDAFGTRSEAACHTFLSQLAALCMGEPDYGPIGWTPDEMELNAALNMVSGIRPRNEMEAALAAQMVAVHLMTMRVSAQAMKWGQADERSMATAGRLARTFAQQAEAMAKLKGRTGKQKISVRYERHNHQHEHKHLHAGDGGGSDFGGRPHESNRRADRVATMEHETCGAMPSPHAPENGVPVPRHARARAVPNPRGRNGVGGTEG